MCGLTFESILHIASCPMLNRTFNTLIDLTESTTNLKQSPSLLLKLFGCTGGGGALHPLPPGLFSLFLMLWKLIIFSLVQLDIDNVPFSHGRIWRLALDRFRERAEALKHAHTLAHLRTLGRGSSAPPNPAKANAALTPLASLDSEGILTYHEAFSDLVIHFTANPNPPNRAP